MMRDLNKERLATKSKKINVEHPECHRTIDAKKARPLPKTEKAYKVTVTFIELPEEEARLKRAIVESIMKKSYIDKDS